MKNPFKKTKKMVIIITETRGMTTREVVGDDLEKKEIEFVMRDVDAKLRTL